jgi:hypothetical protein
MAGFCDLINIRFHNLYLSSGTGRNWSGLTFRYASFLSLPIPATAQAPTLWVMGAAQIEQLKHGT